MDNVIGKILTQSDIEKILNKPNENSLFISPLLDFNQIGDTSIDLRLGHRFLISNPSRMGMLDLTEMNSEKEGVLRDSYREIRISYGNYFTLHPGNSVQIGTLEYLGMPRNIQGVVTLRSSISNIPIIGNTVFIHPGYRGVVTLSIISNPKFSITFYPGLRIAELKLFKISAPVKSPKMSRYHLNIRPTPSKLYKDEEIKLLGPSVEPLIVGVASTLAAGRSTFINRLTEKYGFVFFSLTQVLKDEAKDTGITLDRRSMQEFGTNLRKNYGESYLATRLRSSREWLNLKHSLAIVDGFKHPAEVDEFRKQKRFILVGIDAPLEERWKRTKIRQEKLLRFGPPITHEEFLKLDSTDIGDASVPYGQQVLEVLKMANIKIDNKTTESEFISKIDKAIPEIFKNPIR